MQVSEGRIPYLGHSTWYRSVGETEPGKLPLLCLHGGPGAAHDYLEPLEAMAATGRRTVFYDQLGCGRSPHPHDPSRWTTQLFLEEVDTVRGALGLDRAHVLGQSWGGMLGMEYALTQPAGLASLTIASSPSSMRLWVEEANRLREQLPDDVQQTLLRHERAGTTDDPEYEKACEVFYARHVCRVQPPPDCYNRSMAQLPNQVYLSMNGPSEFHCIGTLREWDVTPRLGEIRVPTLVTSGRHDEATPLIAQTVADAIPGAEWVLFENSSHTSHIEEPERYVEVLDGFLTRVESDLTS
ncbi:MAG: proline iminopeptidase-family hydrolase [Mycobacteriaceae bacterium]